MAKGHKTEKPVQAVYEFVRRGFQPHFWELEDQFPSNPLWRKLTKTRSELWLDTGDIEAAEKLWTREFTALTTNNTLLNKEVQKGHYDNLILEANQLLSEIGSLDEQERKLELAFILNAKHGLKLVEKFDAYVSVEEHTDLAWDVDGAVEYARRYHAICPERFIVKIPFTPAGLLATRKLVAEDIPINHTLGFSARQNYLIARIAKPLYVNVFMGRLNSFIQDNRLGDGGYVGEKATLASQRAIWNLKETHHVTTRQIGASFRSGQQIFDLAGIEVMTMPTNVAETFLAMNLSPEQITDKTGMDYRIGLDPKMDPSKLRLETLWEVDQKLIDCVDRLEEENLDAFTPDDLLNFFEDHDCGDVLVRWTECDLDVSMEEGKIPRLENWIDALLEKSVGLDSLMNFAGLNSFAADQEAMDDRVLDLVVSRELA